MKNQLNFKRRLKYGSLATAITVIFLAALVLVNVIFSLLMERFPLEIDLTPDNRYGLSEDSINYIKEINTDVVITVLSDEDDMIALGNRGGTTSDLYKQAYELLHNYARNSEHITLRFVDPVTNPTVTQNYPEESFSTYDFMVESDLRMKRVNFRSLLSYNQSQYDGSVTYRSDAEQQITSAIMYVTDENPTRAVLLTGLDTPDLSAYMDVLTSNNYEVVEQNLMMEDIDPEAAFAILPQPSVDLTADQVKKLENYLDNNGQFDKGLVFVASQTSEVGPVLKNFLAEWGVEIGNGFLYETNDQNIVTFNFMRSPYIILNTLENKDVIEAMGNASNASLLVPFARPVNITFGRMESEEEDKGPVYASGNRYAYIVSQTADTAVMIPPDADENFDLQQATQQSYPTAVISSRVRYEQTTPHTSYVISLGSAAMLQADYMTTQQLANSSLMVALTEQMTGKTQEVSILPLNITIESIMISGAQVRIYLIVLVILVPLATLAIGVVVWLRRRHL